MMNIRIGLVLSLVLLLVISPRASCLECYRCTSYVSWADCDKHTAIQICKDPVLDTCIKAHRVIDKLNGQQTHEFYKTCFYSGDCTVESCRATNEVTKGSWCDLECCNTTLCNTGVTQWARKNMPQTMLQVGGGGNHVTYASASHIGFVLLTVLMSMY